MQDYYNDDFYADMIGGMEDNSGFEHRDSFSDPDMDYDLLGTDWFFSEEEPRMFGSDSSSASAMTMMVEAEESACAESSCADSATQLGELSAGAAFSGKVERILRTKEKTVYLVRTSGGAAITCSLMLGIGSAPLRGDNVRGHIVSVLSGGGVAGVIENAGFVSI